MAVPRGTAVGAGHPRTWKSPECPVGGRSLGPLLVTIPWDTSAPRRAAQGRLQLLPTVGALTVPLQGEAWSSECLFKSAPSHPPRLSYVTSRPQTHGGASEGRV